MWFIWLWVIGGVIVGAGLLTLESWTRNRNIAVTWYDRLLGAIGILLLLFTIQNFFASFGELEPTAAWMFALVTGLPAVILLAIAWVLIQRRRSAAG